jgi:hypothetical protein
MSNTSVSLYTTKQNEYFMSAKTVEQHQII